MIKKISFAFIALIAVFFVVVQLQPGEYRVERSLEIAAPREKIFENVVDFRKWEPWSPWAKLDPQSKVEFLGKDASIGSIMKWSGNSDVGVGQMELVELLPNEKIGIKLSFLEPMKSEADTEIFFEEKNEFTKVRWVMSGKNDFIGKIFCLFMNMDQMIGADFERGLKSLSEVSQR